MVLANRLASRCVAVLLDGGLDSDRCGNGSRKKGQSGSQKVGQWIGGGDLAYNSRLHSYCATMATRGNCTPLPTASAPSLVIAGPYRYVRNPMALPGIAQGIAVGAYLGSYGVIAYSLLGAIFWHIIVRPVGERDLVERIGESYDHYRTSVRLWLPRRAAP